MVYVKEGSPASPNLKDKWIFIDILENTKADNNVMIHTYEYIPAYVSFFVFNQIIRMWHLNIAWKGKTYLFLHWVNKRQITVHWELNRHTEKQNIIHK